MKVQESLISDLIPVEVEPCEPFHPFQVELVDGKVIIIERPSLALGGGAATMITDDQFVEFECENVRDIRHVPIPSL